MRAALVGVRAPVGDPSVAVVRAAELIHHDGALRDLVPERPGPVHPGQQGADLDTAVTATISPAGKCSDNTVCQD